MKIAEISINDIIRRCEAAEKILILAHTNPDGDCIGSAGALSVILNSLGKKTFVATPDEMQDRLKFIIPEQENCMLPVGDEDNYDLIVSVDVASVSQLGSFGYLEGKIDIMIDHHGMGEAFAPYYRDTKASASGEIVWEIYRTLKKDGRLSSSPETARRCYAAILSDTGSFRYSNVTPETHIIASELVSEMKNARDGGMTAEKICNELFSKRTINDLNSSMMATKNLRVFEGGKLAVVMMRADEAQSLGLEESDLGGTVEIPRSLDGVLIAISMRQTFTDPGKFKVSSRSNCDISVAELCGKFDGGGHAKAAGCTVFADSPEEALDKVVKVFGEALR